MKNFGLSNKVRLVAHNPFRRILSLVVVLFMFFPPPLQGAPQSNEKISLNLKDVSIVQFFREIESRTSYKFFYKSSQVESTPNVSLNAVNQSVEDILKNVFANTKLTFTFNENQIVIDVRDDRQARPTTVRGTVTDKNGKPIFGVNVVVPGTSHGTTTDAAGRFVLSLANMRGNTIRFSIVGMNPQTLPIDNRESYSVVMTEEVFNVSEVVITGYQRISKERSTGAYNIIDSAMLAQSRAPSLRDKIEEFTPGLYFEPNFIEDQNPTENSKLQMIIRGATTFGDNRNPLIVVDGFPASSASDPWKTINPDDVENISVLKDASAASIWGAQAANGVIVITTKKGKSSIPKVGAMVDFFAQPTPNLWKIPWASSEEAVELYKWMAFDAHRWEDIKTNNEAFNRIDLPPVIKTIATALRGDISMDEMDKQLDILKKIDIRDEFKRLFLNKVETNTRVNVSFQMGNENHNLRTSLTSTFNDRYNKGKTRTDHIINISEIYKPSKWLNVSLGTNITLAREKNNGVAINELNYLNQITRILDDEGNYLPMIAQFVGNSYDKYYGTVGNNQARRNLVEQYNLPYDWDYNLKREADNKDNTSKNLDMTLTSQLSFFPIAGLRLDLSYQYQYLNRYTRNFYNEETWQVRNQVNNNAQRDGTYPVPPGNMLAETKGQGYSNNCRALLTYNKQFGSHSFIIMGGTDWEKEYFDEIPYGYYSYDPQSISFATQMDFKNAYPKLSGAYNYYQTLQQIPGQYWVSMNGTDNRYVSYYGNVGYTFDNRYDFNSSIRLDKTNLFGSSSDNPNLPQWSLGAGWTISNENFANKFSIVDYLRLRITYGWMGNIDKSASPYLYGYAWVDPVLKVPYSAIQSAPNPGLTWEKTAQYNFGLDYAMFGNKIRGSINYYIKNTKDALVQMAVNGTYGFQNNRATLNAGRIENRGFEFQINASVLDKGDFKWQSMFMYSTNKNMARDITTVSSSIMAYTTMAFYYRKPDHPLSYLAAIEWAGYDDKGLPQFVYDGEVCSVSEFTALSQLEMDKLFKFVGQKDPKHFGSWQNSFSYKNFDLSIRLSYKFGHKVIGDYPASNMTSNSFMSPTKFYSFLPAMMVDRWKSSADDKTASMYCLDNVITNSAQYQLLDAIAAYGTQNVYDAWSVRLQSVSLSYSPPQVFLKKIGLRDLRLTLEARNLGPIFKATDFDPDNVPYSSSTYGALMFVTRNRPEFSLGLSIGLF